MQLFAWEHEGCYWLKREITWAVMNESRTISREDAEEVMEAAFEKWAAKIPLKFKKISHRQQPDIRVRFGETEPIEGLYPMGYAEHIPEGELDDEGVDIVFDDHMDWANEKDLAYYRNLRYCGLLMIGHALGLGNSKNTRAIMYDENRGYRSKSDPVLDNDDIRGIQALYSIRGSSEPSSRLPANLKPASSIPVEPTPPPVRSPVRPPVAASSSSSRTVTRPNAASSRSSRPVTRRNASSSSSSSSSSSESSSDSSNDDNHRRARYDGWEAWGRDSWDRNIWERGIGEHEMGGERHRRRGQGGSESREGSGALKKIRNFLFGKK